MLPSVQTTAARPRASGSTASGPCGVNRSKARPSSAASVVTFTLMARWAVIVLADGDSQRLPY